MSIPSTDATQSIDNTVTETPEVTLEDQLAVANKRHNDTKAGYTKGQQKIKSLEAENAELLKQLEATTQVIITTEQQEELDALKYENPEEWRTKLNTLETEARSKSKAQLAESTDSAKMAAEASFELDRRKQVLQEFNDSNDIAITEELIANDVTPRITSKLAKGEITFEEFLVEVKAYVSTPKTIKNEETLEQPSLGNLGGGSKPSKDSAEKSVQELYESGYY